MAFDFSPSEEQTMLIDTVRQFMAKEIFPHEREVERLGEVPLELGKQIQKRSKELGLFAANMPEDVGGGGLDYVSVTLMDRELGKSTWGLMGWVGRPSEILNACRDEQRETYLLPGDPRRAQGGLRADRAQCGIRCHGHPDPRGQGWRRLCHQRQQAFHHLRLAAGFRHPVHRHRCRRDAEGPAQADHGFPGG